VLLKIQYKEYFVVLDDFLFFFDGEQEELAFLSSVTKTQ